MHDQWKNAKADCDEVKPRKPWQDCTIGEMYVGS